MSSLVCNTTSPYTPHYCTTSLLHYCTTALQHYCTTLYCTTALLHYCTTAHTQACMQYCTSHNFAAAFSLPCSTAVAATCSCCTAASTALLHYFHERKRSKAPPVSLPVKVEAILTQCISYCILGLVEEQQVALGPSRQILH